MASHLTRTATYRTPETLSGDLIAPCGINCGTCYAHMRAKKPCPGCINDEAAEAPSRRKCIIRNCQDRTDDQCGACRTFPCARLRDLDKRYRTNYDENLIGNLRRLREQGIETYVEEEKRRWLCGVCGGVRSVHSKECPHCARPVVR